MYDDNSTQLSPFAALHSCAVPLCALSTSSNKAVYGSCHSCHAGLVGTEVHAAVALPVQCVHSKAPKPNQFPRNAGASQLLSIHQSTPTPYRQQQSAGSSPQLSETTALHAAGKPQGSSAGSPESLHSQGSSAGCRADAACASQQMVSTQRSTLDTDPCVQLADETASSTTDSTLPGPNPCGGQAGLQQISPQALIAVGPSPQQQQCGSPVCAQQSPSAPVKSQDPVCDTDCCKAISDPTCTVSIDDSMQASGHASCPQCNAVGNSQLVLQGIKVHQQVAMAAEVQLYTRTQAAGTDLRHNRSSQPHQDPLVSHGAESEAALQSCRNNSPDVSASVLLPQTNSQAPHRQQPVAAAALLQLDGTSVEVAQHVAVLDMQQADTTARQTESDALVTHMASSWSKNSQADTHMEHSNEDVHSHGAMHAAPLESSLLAQAGTEAAAAPIAEAAISGSSTDDTHGYGLKSCCTP